MDRREVVIVGAARTPVGRFQGTLAQVPAPDLGAVAIRAAIQRAGIEPSRVDEVFMGEVIQAGVGQAPARQASLDAGIPDTVGATTINKVCGSGLKAVTLGMQAIQAGAADVIVAGGMENMNLGPHLLPHARTGYRLGSAEMLDATVHDGLWCACENWHMGEAAEFIAAEYGISREEMDRYSLESHRKAIRAIDAGKFEAEIAPVDVPQRRGEPILFDVDETPRRDTSMEALSRLRPAFRDGGRVTAGNAPPICDGAAALVVMGADVAHQLDITPMARITGQGQGAVHPKWIFRAPVEGVRDLLERADEDLASFDLIEVNEAFAAQILANGQELGWDWDKVNVHGGAIALGHPIGATGARILVTLLYAIRDRDVHKGLAALCLGGGEAVAMSVERMED